MQGGSADCDICFTEITEGIALPCACTVNVCRQCWDRCLLQSFRAVGWARCPTCRSAVHVDFDAESCSLAFSKMAIEPTECQGSRNAHVERLAAQVLPAQVQILQRFGVLHPEVGQALRESPSCGLESSCTGFAPPKCVCGCGLKRTRVADRPDRPRWCSSIICDTCDKRVGMQGIVWTCTSGADTILHARAHDVCDKCFMEHAFPAGPQHTATSTSKPVGGDVAAVADALVAAADLSLASAVVPTMHGDAL